jgi:hypothetical protein
MHTSHEQNFINNLKHEFAIYGFVSCPLTDAQLERLPKNSMTISQAYAVGCDVEAGFDFDTALSNNL